MPSIDSQILANKARAVEAKELAKKYSSYIDENDPNQGFIDSDYPEDKQFSAKFWSVYAPSLQEEFFVNENGVDNDPVNYPGKSPSGAFRTIERACQAAAEAKVQLYMEANPGTLKTEAEQATDFGYRMDLPLTIAIKVAAGTYNEKSEIRVPAYTTIIGETLRATIVNWDEERPADPSEIKNLFLLNNACYIYNLRPSNGPGVDDLGNPKTGFYFAFDNNAFIKTSPYIQNCTTSYVPFDKFYVPLDTQQADSPEPNPNVGNGPGGMIVDDSVLDGYSPLKSMIVDAYTQVAFNGVGLCVRGRGYAQMVSFFTNFSRVGVFAIDGGHASLLNSNTTFGDYGLRAEGKRFLVVADKSQVSDHTNTALSQQILVNKEDILRDMFIDLDTKYPGKGYGDSSSTLYNATLKDASLLIDCIASDFTNDSPDRTAQFVQGQFGVQDLTENKDFTTASGVATVYDLSLVDEFIDSFEYIRNAIRTYCSEITDDDQSSVKLYAIISMIQEVHREIVKENKTIENLKGYDPENPENTGLVRPFGSLITSTAHDFSYAGSGVNFLGLPNNQSGIGATDFDIRIYQQNEGRVYHTSGDEFGDFFAGNDFVIRQETGTIEGRTFSKALFALVTPFSLALES